MTPPSVIPKRSPLDLRIGRRIINLPTLLTMTVVWMLLFGELSLTMALGGVLVGTLIMLVFPLPTVSLGLRLHPVGLAVFLGHFIVDLVVSSARVVAQSFARRPPRSSILAIPLRTRSDLLLTITAICVSVIPGSVIVEVRSGTFTLFVHMLGTDVDAAEDARRKVFALEERVARAFGTREEIERVEAGGDT